MRSPSLSHSPSVGIRLADFVKTLRAVASYADAS